MSRRVTVPVIAAAALYRIHGNWAKVAKDIQRRSGRRFQSESIRNAVRRYDRRAA
jgi:hypothetical protein